MLPQLRTGGSAQRTRGRRKMPLWLLALLVLAMGGLLIAGPTLYGYAQGAGSEQPAATTTTPAPAPSDAATAPTPEPTHTDAAPAEAATPHAAAHGGGGEAIQLPFTNTLGTWLPLIIVLLSAFLALGFGGYWWAKTMKASPGSDRMQGVAKAVQEGAMAYLSRQVKTMIPLVLVIMVGLFILYWNQYKFMDAGGDKVLGFLPLSIWLALGVAVAFMLGVVASYLAGYVGMGVAVRGNVRVANAALSSFKSALEIAFQAGAVSGMFTVGLGLLGATITFMIFQQNAMFVLVGFGFGGSLAALFMRVGGGIFTKAADVGADLVGKVEAGIPEDDPRNAATIADNVGDNVGDCAGMAADVFESYEVTLVAAIILAAAVGAMLQGAGFGNMMDGSSFTSKFTLALVTYALLVRAVGVVASIIGVLAVRGKDDPKMNPMKPINTGFWTSSAIATLGFLVVSYFVFGFNPSAPTMAEKFTQPAFNFANQPLQATPALVEGLTKNGLTATDMPAIMKRVEGMRDDILKFDPKAEFSVSGLNRIVTKAIEENGAAGTMTADSGAMERRFAAMNAAGTLLTLGQPQQSMFGGIQPSIMQPQQVDEFLSGIEQHSVLGKKIAGWFWIYAFIATFIGIVLTQVIGKLTEHFTADDKQPVTEIASSAKTGPATLILSGLSEGLESSVWAVVAIAATIAAAFFIFPNPALVAYAIALAGLGLLATTGYVLAMDTYGPISDNANGIFEMSGALKNEDGTENTAAHHIVARLDMVGNTTKALTKGFAIATAVIAAVALYRSFLDTVAIKDAAILVKNIQVNLPEVFVGLLIGGAIPFLFSSFAIRAVSRAAVQLVEEVRRQFRTIPGIWEYTGVGEEGKPDYARCVAISTAAAQKELLGPGLLAVFAPMLVGFALGPYSLGGFLAGAILAGQLMAVFMSNAGGAWDNAKKKIEDGFLGGKGSEAHKAGVIGDTVGDPLKDTAGPALNPMIKVMNLVAILVAPTTVILQSKEVFYSFANNAALKNVPLIKDMAITMDWVKVGILIVVLGVLVFAVWWSKRGGVGLEAGETEGNGQAPTLPETPAEV